MIRPSPRWFTLAAAVAMVAPCPSIAADGAKLSYNADIQPILAENCFACHGPDSATRKGKLRLDRRADATSPRDDGKHDPAIVPGDPAASLLVERIKSTDDEERMPPLDSHKSLKPSEIALLERWVIEGAEYQPHWSLIAPTRPAVPTPALAKDWGRNPIDAFIAQKIIAAGLTPSAPETPARLLRRLTFDLTGLPPSPEDIAAFERNPSVAAYDRIVDRLLATDASAEHFARQWLDAIRYADTHGIHIDNFRSIWPFRDWVIGAFKRNEPFDQFTVEQMAGDLLPSATLDQKIGSGYNRCLPTTNEGGAIPEEYEVIYAKDRVDTMATVWLGLTVGCAACHDHKFDPVSQRDFYALTAFFRNNTMPAMDGNFSDATPSLFVPAAKDRVRWPALEKEITAQQAALAERAKIAETDFAAWAGTAQALPEMPRDFTVSLHLPLNDEAAPFRTTAGNDLLRGQPAPAFTKGPHGPAPRLNDLDVVLGPPLAMRREVSASFSLLVRIDGQPNGTLLSSMRADGADSGWELFFENGKLGVNFVDARGKVSARGVTGNALSAGEWHHVLFTNDSAAWRSRSIEVFVDGKAATSTGEISSFPYDIEPTAPLRLGSQQGVDGKATKSLTGGDVWIQDLRQYNRGFRVEESKPMTSIFDAAKALAISADARSEEQQKALRSYYLQAVDRPSLAIAKKLNGLLAETADIRKRGGVTLVMEEKRDSEPIAHILNRGEYTQRQQKVGAATPEALPPMPADVPRNRLGLARWLVDARNPLTARVTVNRAWQYFFGTGIVESSGDFGVTGTRPSHPELLDWLAVEFRDSGWDYRKLVRLMVTSATYRQSAIATPAARERDPDNRLLARGPRSRLEAEPLRDQALAASGLLVAKVGGPPVRPYQPDGIWEDVAMKQSTTRFYRVGSGEDLYRRSLYTMWKRTAPPPAMDILNAPSREVTCVRRDRTNTPLQALVVLNDPLFIEASRQLAAHALRETKSTDGRLDYICGRLLGRKLASTERQVVRQTLTDALAAYQHEPAEAAKLLTVGASPVDKLPAVDLAAWTVVTSEIMNLDEALTK